MDCLQQNYDKGHSSNLRGFVNFCVSHVLGTINPNVPCSLRDIGQGGMPPCLRSRSQCLPGRARDYQSSPDTKLAGWNWLQVSALCDCFSGQTITKCRWSAQIFNASILKSSSLITPAMISISLCSSSGSRYSGITQPSPHYLLSVVIISSFIEVIISIFILLTLRFFQLFQFPPCSACTTRTPVHQFSSWHGQSSAGIAGVGFQD